MRNQLQNNLLFHLLLGWSIRLSVRTRDFHSLKSSSILLWTTNNPTNMEKTKNQVRRVSENKNLRKILFKTSNASIILFKDIDYVNASIRIKTLKRIYSDWRGEFIITR